MICCPVLLSRLPVGSSANKIAGWVTKALAKATLCCSPPDSWLGLWVNRLVSPTLPSNFFAADPAALSPLNSSGSITFSRAVRLGNNWKDWNTKPIIWLRNSALPSSSMAVRLCSAMIIEPQVGVSSPASNPNRVDFPEPDAPIIATLSADLISRSTDDSICKGPAEVLTVLPRFSVMMMLFK